MLTAQVLVGDVRQRLSELPDASVQSCITSPPYWGLRDYGNDGQIGLEQTPDAYVQQMVNVFREVRRVLKDDGTLWLNLGDSYAGSGRGPEGNLSKNQDFRFMQNKTGFITPNNLKPKDLVGIPWRVAFALQADGWWLRQDIIWHKPNPMPESVTDRCTKAHEYVFLLTKTKTYFFDALKISEPIAESSKKRYQHAIDTNEQFDPNKHKHTEGVQSPVEVLVRAARGVIARGVRNKRSVWTIPTKPFKGAHFAVMPEALVEPCVLAGSREGDTVLDPFTGSGTVAVVAMRHGRNFVGTELNADYAEIARERIESHGTLFGEVVVK